MTDRLREKARELVGVARDGRQYDRDGFIFHADFEDIAEQIHAAFLSARDEALEEAAAAAELLVQGPEPYTSEMMKDRIRSLKSKVTP